MTTDIPLKRSARRKNILLKNSVLVMLGYSIPITALLIARMAGIASYSYSKVMVYAIWVLAVTLVLFVATKMNRDVSDSFVKKYNALHFLNWLLSFWYVLQFSNEVRMSGLLFALLILIFCLPVGDYVFAIVFTIAATLVYLAASFYSINYLGHEGVFIKDVWFAAVFFPCGIYISFMTDRFKKQRTELHETKKRIEKAHIQIEEKNNKIMGSIHYARMIQQSLLPCSEHVRMFHPEFFTIWKPRDIVGGDIIFFETFGDDYIAALIDCTGHGVPGACMSMIISSGLRQIVKDEGCHDPAKILCRLDAIVKSTLQMDAEHSATNDGADMGIWIFKPKMKTLSFSSANMPMYYVKNNELNILKGDRRSIGYKTEYKQSRYANHTIELQEGMMFYILSDGYTDQLGEKADKIFGKKYVKNLIRQIHIKPLPMQREIFLQKFHEYKGSFEQLDDVTVVAFKITLGE